MNPYLIAFFALPPLLVIASLGLRRPRLWPALTVFCLVGWVLVVFDSAKKVT